MKTADLVVADGKQVLTCGGPLPKRGTSLGDVGLMTGTWIASHQGRIVFVGSKDRFENEVLPAQEAVWVDGSRFVCLPGFVDSHNHLPFAGGREEEFALRLKGLTYQELAKRDMGIQTTVRATRAVSPEELAELVRRRLDQMLLLGTTTTEAKSGYGLNLEDEIKQLEVLRGANESHPIDIIPTFMGAHEIPPEYKEKKDEYINLLITKIIPEIRRRNLAVFFDIFCEQGVFSLADTRKLFRAAKQAGFRIKAHADEFSAMGGTELAVEQGAASADHLINITEEGIDRLSRSDTVAILLPAVPFFLMLDKKAPARKLIEKGAVVAVATDFNPGSSMTESMLFSLQLGVFLLRMSIEEAVNACTANAAFSLGIQSEVGTLEEGKKMDLLLCDLPNYLHLVYHPGINPVRHVIKNGKIVVKDGRIV